MAETTTKRHPIRGALWGLLLGLGVFIYVTLVFPVIALESLSSVITQGVIIVVVVMILSMLWGLYGPAKKPKGPPPASAQPATAVRPAAADDSEGPPGDV